MWNYGKTAPFWKAPAWFLRWCGLWISWKLFWDFTCFEMPFPFPSESFLCITENSAWSLQEFLAGLDLETGEPALFAAPCTCFLAFHWKRLFFLALQSMESILYFWFQHWFILSTYIFWNPSHKHFRRVLHKIKGTNWLSLKGSVHGKLSDEPFGLPPL